MWTRELRIDHVHLVELVENNVSMVKGERLDWNCSGVVGSTLLYSEACGENCMLENKFSSGLWSKLCSRSDPKTAGNGRYSCSLLIEELLLRFAVCPWWLLC